MARDSGTTDWRAIAEQAKREAAEWKQNFAVLQKALVGETGASGIEVAGLLRKDAERWRWYIQPGERQNACSRLEGQAFVKAVDEQMAAEKSHG
jgi:hypothetical protein